VNPRSATLAVPERPTLDVLRAALDASDAALRREHPTLDEWPRQPGSPITLVAAALLLARFEELQALLACYLAAVDSANGQHGDDPF